MRIGRDQLLLRDEGKGASDIYAEGGRGNENGRRDGAVEQGERERDDPHKEQRREPPAEDGVRSFHPEGWQILHRK